MEVWKEYYAIKLKNNCNEEDNIETNQEYL